LVIAEVLLRTKNEKLPQILQVCPPGWERKAWLKVLFVVKVLLNPNF